MTPEQLAALAAIQQGSALITAAERALRSVVEPAPVPAPPPAPPAEPPAEPPVEPPPAPPPPIPPGAFEVHVEKVFADRLPLHVDVHDSADSYQRWQKLTMHPAPLTWGLFDLVLGGGRLTFPAGTYTLEVDGQDLVSKEFPAGLRVSFVGIDLPPGYRRVGLRGPDGLRAPSWFVHSGEVGVDALIPTCTGSYEISHSVKVPKLEDRPPGWRAIGTHKWTLVPADAEPTAVPLTQRVPTPFSTQLPPAQTHRRMLVAEATPRRVYRRGSVRTTFGSQSYFFMEMTEKYPKWPLLDGPRGKSTLSMMTHALVGRATTTADPASKPIGAIYATDPWRLVRVNADGSLRTLVGYRHEAALYWEDAKKTQPTLVGDWSRVKGVHGLHECWGFEFDPSTLGVDPTAPLIGGRPPHHKGPTGYLADTQNNRALRVEFDGHSHDTPAIVTEHLTGLGDPWRVVVDPVRGWLLVSERTLHRVSAWDIKTGEFIKVVLQGQPLSKLVNRQSLRTASLDACRAAPLVAPEGLALRGDWLYIGSMAQLQVRRVHLVTGVVQVMVNIPFDSNVRFVDVAVSDGTVGPEGTVFVASWSNARVGFPSVYLPDGTQWYPGVTASTGAHAGRPPWQALSYASGVGVGNGVWVCGSADWGMHIITKAQATDPTPDPKLTAAGLEQMESLLWGPGGISPWGLPPPRGRTAGMDHLLDLAETP